MAVEIKRSPVALLTQKETLHNLDAHRFPELAAVNDSPVPAPTPKQSRWERPKSPCSPLDAPISRRPSSKSLKSSSSCSDLESLDSWPVSPKQADLQQLPSLPRSPSISHPIHEGTFAELGFSGGEHRAMSAAQQSRFEEAWARRARQYRLPTDSQALDTWELRSNSGNRYFITADPLKRGGCAEFGLAVDEAGSRYGVRKVRMEPGENEQTASQLPSDIHQETWAIKLYTPALDIIDKVRSGEHVYQIVPLMMGDVHGLLKLEQRVFGGTLRDALTRHVGVQLCTSLKHMHDKGVVHGDQKSSNALWDGSGKVVLSDVGGVSHVNTSGHVPEDRLPTITPAYLAPEFTGQDIPQQYRGETAMAEDSGDPPALTPYHQAVDVWSLGFLLLEPYVGAQGTPLEDMRDPFFALMALRDLFAWSQKPEEEASHGNGWANYFGECARQAPELTRFVLDRMLDFNPATRATVREVKAFLQAEQARCGDDPEAVKAAFTRLSLRASSDPQRRAHLASILARRDAVVDSAP